MTKDVVFAHKPTKGKATAVKKQAEKIIRQERKTKIPMTRIKKLIKLKQALDDEVKDIIQTYDVNMSYIRGLLKDSMKDTGVKKK